MKTGIIIVDHGSRRDESNRMLEEVARLFGERKITGAPVVNGQELFTIGAPLREQKGM